MMRVGLSSDVWMRNEDRKCNDGGSSDEANESGNENAMRCDAVNVHDRDGGRGRDFGLCLYPYRGSCFFEE